MMDDIHQSRHVVCKFLGLFDPICLCQRWKRWGADVHQGTATSDNERRGDRNFPQHEQHEGGWQAGRVIPRSPPQQFADGGAEEVGIVPAQWTEIDEAELIALRDGPIAICNTAYGRFEEHEK